MKLTLPKSTLSSALGAVSSVCGRALPILSFCKVESPNEASIELSATDLDCHYKRTAAAVVMEPGSCLLPVSRVKEWLGEIKASEVTIEAKGQQLILSAQDCGQQRFQTDKVENFPAIPVADEKKIATADFSGLRDISWSIPKGDRLNSRPELAAIFLEAEGGGLIAATTNGYCCGTVTIKAEVADKEFSKLAIPADHIDLVAGLGECEMTESEKAIIFTTPVSRLHITKSQYGIPNWRVVISQHPYIGSCVVMREEFKQAISICHLNRGSERGIRVELDPVTEGMKISCVNPTTNDGYDHVIMGRTKGEFPAIAFNSEYLTPFFSLKDESPLKIQFTTDQTIAHFNAGSVDYYFLPLHRRKA